VGEGTGVGSGDIGVGVGVGVGSSGVVDDVDAVVVFEGIGSDRSVRVVFNVKSLGTSSSLGFAGFERRSIANDI
jgi:hypothetical protein